MATRTRRGRRGRCGTNVAGLEEMEDNGKIRTLKDATDPFCVSRVRFAVNGRGNCEASAHRTGLFAATPPAENRKLLFEFFERDFKEAGS